MHRVCSLGERVSPPERERTWRAKKSANSSGVNLHRAQETKDTTRKGYFAVNKDAVEEIGVSCGHTDMQQTAFCMPGRTRLPWLPKRLTVWETVFDYGYYVRLRLIFKRPQHGAYTLCHTTVTTCLHRMLAGFGVPHQNKIPCGVPILLPPSIAFCQRHCAPHLYLLL